MGSGRASSEGRTRRLWARVEPRRSCGPLASGRMSGQPWVSSARQNPGRGHRDPECPHRAPWCVPCWASCRLGPQQDTEMPRVTPPHRVHQGPALSSRCPRAHGGGSTGGILQVLLRLRMGLKRGTCPRDTSSSPGARLSGALEPWEHMRRAAVSGLAPSRHQPAGTLGSSFSRRNRVGWTTWPEAQLRRGRGVRPCLLRGLCSRVDPGFRGPTELAPALCPPPRSSVPGLVFVKQCFS